MMMNRRQVMGVVAAAGAMGPSMASARDMPGFDTALQTTFDAATAPALGGMVVGPGRAIWTGAKGVRHNGAPAVTTDDLWHLGSNTKAMTAALYGRLVDQGRVSWDDTLSTLLPDVAMNAAWRDVPVTQVMAHRAGITDEASLGSSWLTTARADKRSVQAQRLGLAESLLSAAPVAPGTFAYSNGAYIVLGAIIERTTGLSWEDAMRSEVFEPLAITSAGFGAPQGDQPWGHIGGQGVDPTGPVTDNPLALGPAGTVHMSLDDYGRFLRVFLADGAGWLKPETVLTLMRPVGEGPSPYAGGWLVPSDQPWAQGPCLTHDGSNTLWYASAWVAPAIGRAFVAVSNDAQRGRPACQALIPGLIGAL